MTFIRYGLAFTRNGPRGIPLIILHVIILIVSWFAITVDFLVKRI